MSSLTVTQSKITNVDMLPTNMPSIDGLVLNDLPELLSSKLFSSDVSYLYGAGDCVQEIKGFDAVGMFRDMKHFMHAYEGDMVVFYSKEINLKFGNDDLVMDYLQYLQLDYIKMTMERICDDMIGLVLKPKTDKPIHISENYNDEEKDLLLKFLDECKYNLVLWKDTINSPRELSERGFVYILEDSESGLVKIGRSEQPKSRIASIKTSSGRNFSRVYISDYIYDYKRAELSAHEAFSKDRGIGEWFGCNYEDALETVKSIACETPKPDDHQVIISELIKRYNSDITSAFMINIMEGNSDVGFRI